MLDCPGIPSHSSGLLFHSLPQEEGESRPEEASEGQDGPKSSKGQMIVERHLTPTRKLAALIKQGMNKDAALIKQAALIKLAAPIKQA